MTSCLGKVKEPLGLNKASAFPIQQIMKVPLYEVQPSLLPRLPFSATLSRPRAPPRHWSLKNKPSSNPSRTSSRKRRNAARNVKKKNTNSRYLKEKKGILGDGVGAERVIGGGEVQVETGTEKKRGIEIERGGGVGHGVIQMMIGGEEGEEGAGASRLRTGDEKEGTGTHHHRREN